MQKVLTMWTLEKSLRSSATSWTAEDPGLLQPGYIGMTPAMKEFYGYETPFHALADGWKLLVPPSACDTVEWEWWFVKD